VLHRWVISELEFYDTKNHPLADNKLSVYAWLVRHPGSPLGLGHLFVSESDPSETVAFFRRTCLDETCVDHEVDWDCERTLRLLKC
jgi:hypothetical protein